MVSANFAGFYGAGSPALAGGGGVRTAAKAPADPIEAARAEAYGLARGATRDRNPIDAQILEMLQQRAGPQGGPYDDATRSALMTQASDAAGQAALNAKGRIQGSAGDPSVMAANNEADARRAQAIQQAQLGINTQAGLANYDARGQALGQLGGYNQQVQRNQTDNQRFLIDMLTREQQTIQQPRIDSGIPDFGAYRGSGDTLAAWQSRNASAPQATAAPTMVRGTASPSQTQQAATPASYTTPAPVRGAMNGPPVAQAYTGPSGAAGLNPYATRTVSPTTQGAAPFPGQAPQPQTRPLTRVVAPANFNPWNNIVQKPGA